MRRASVASQAVSRCILTASLFVLVSFLFVAPAAHGQSAGQSTYSSQDEATQTLAAAAKAKDRTALGHITPATAAKAIAIGVLANTLLKLVIGIVVGVKGFRKVVLIGLSVVALASAISLVWLR